MVVAHLLEFHRECESIRFSRPLNPDPQPVPLLAPIKALAESPTLDPGALSTAFTDSLTPDSFMSGVSDPRALRTALTESPTLDRGALSTALTESPTLRQL